MHDPHRKYRLVALIAESILIVILFLSSVETPVETDAPSWRTRQDSNLRPLPPEGVGPWPIHRPFL